MTDNTRPNSAEDIEQDVVSLLQTIQPLVSMVASKSNILSAGAALVKQMKKGDFLHFDELLRLFNKYEYLVGLDQYRFEIEYDLKCFLMEIMPLVKLAQGKSKMPMVIAKVVRNIGDDGFINWAKIEQLQQKYKHLIE